MEKKQFNDRTVSVNNSCDLSVTQYELEKKKKIYHSVNLSKLPDKGARLRGQIDEMENKLKALSLEVDAASDDADKMVKTNAVQEFDENVSRIKKNSSCNAQTVRGEKSKNEDTCKNVFLEAGNKPFSKISDTKNMLSFSDLTPKQTVKTENKNVMCSPSFSTWRDSTKVHKTLLTEPKPLIEKSVSKVSQQLFGTNPHFHANEECVKKIHKSLVTYPDETKEESDPENLKSSLMMHQKRGLAWLMWREEQDPPGGILADEMGLGKTLTMISLILKQKEKLSYFSRSEEKNQCRGTLIICLASLIHQWRDEITKHCDYDVLKVLIYHGPQRDKDFKKMKHYDVVLTTYNIVMTERKSMENDKVESPLFKLIWDRIVLDEAHTIKNHTSQTANSVFCLRSFRKWAVTGTPIHNVFKDIYSLIKFLQLSPFDDYKKFKELTNECSDSGERRRNLLIKTIVLRRTKDQVDEWGKPLIEMSDKLISICYIELSPEERKIYDELDQKTKKRFLQYFEKSLKVRSGSSLLVLLLRLQQCCNHLSLLEKETDEDDISSDISKCLSSLTIDDADLDTNSSEISLDLNFDELETVKLRDISFKSSKIKKLFVELNKIADASENKNKSVIVSQWVSMLEVVVHHLREEKMHFHLITGNTKIEDRQKFVNDFNCNEDGAKIMLLSLKAGGVGLNLTGANHLFLLDLHWNPALEMQACDRIHRVGQKKDVVIHKFICKNTIEEKIKCLQDEKRKIASGALRGIKQNTKGLSLDDFRLLFNVRK